jgi:hypothetical protein
MGYYSTRNALRKMGDEERINWLTRHTANNRSVFSKRGVIDWCFPESSFVKMLTPESEKRWGQAIIGYQTNQWTTKLGESLLEEALRLLGKEPVRVQQRQQGENGKHLVPDFETADALYECKARTYTTKGTAGEKILGTPWKYSDCYRLYGKPLYIMCMANQEAEADNDFCVFNTNSEVRQRQLEFWEREAGIRFIKFTDLLKKIV